VSAFPFVFIILSDLAAEVLPSQTVVLTLVVRDRFCAAWPKRWRVRQIASSDGDTIL
jgi:hypothetical protein